MVTTKRTTKSTRQAKTVAYSYSYGQILGDLTNMAARRSHSQHAGPNIYRFVKAAYRDKVACLVTGLNRILQVTYPQNIGATGKIHEDRKKIENALHTIVAFHAQVVERCKPKQKYSEVVIDRGALTYGELIDLIASLDNACSTIKQISPLLAVYKANASKSHCLLSVASRFNMLHVPFDAKASVAPTLPAKPQSGKTVKQKAVIPWSGLEMALKTGVIRVESLFKRQYTMTSTVKAGRSVYAATSAQYEAQHLAAFAAKVNLGEVAADTLVKKYLEELSAICTSAKSCTAVQQKIQSIISAELEEFQNKQVNMQLESAITNLQSKLSEMTPAQRKKLLALIS